MRYIPLAVLVAGAVAIGVAFGWLGLLVYLFIAFVVAAMYYGLGVGGALVREGSRRRFENRR
jgi:hypothetical protein